MPTEIEHALMAGHAYFDTRADINRFPVPSGWTVGRHETRPSGFEAITFQRGAEIVISYAGTYDAVDKAADAALFAGTPSDQLLQAAEYYLQVKAANPGAWITLTGHSLGGGLASLIAVFFDETAVTFDQAPFRNAASWVRAKEVYLDLWNKFPVSTYPEISAWLAPLDRFIDSFDPLGLGWSPDGLAARQAKVTNLSVTGELLSALTALRIGIELPSLDHGVYFDPIDLHSQALLTTFLQNENLRQATFKLPDLLQMIFDENLFKRDEDKGDPNLLEHLIRHQVGVEGTIEADQMLDRFASDLDKLVQAKGEGGAYRDLLKALIAFAMEKYYEETDSHEELFEAAGGGLQFDTQDIAADITGAKGYEQYFANYLGAGYIFSAEERDLIREHLADLRDWSIAVGNGGMNATDSENRGAFMLGGDGSDTLAGGTGADLLVGAAGTDKLAGGAGGDTLHGGAGTDQLAGDGGDDILIGGAGQDTLKGGDDDDILYGDAQEKEDKESRDAGSDSLYGGAGDDELYGGAKRDYLYGEDDDDTLAGNGGADLLNGARGFDTYIYDGRSGSRDVIYEEREGESFLGCIRYDNTVLAGGTRPRGALNHRWTSDDGYIFETSGDPDAADVTLTISGGQGGKLVVYAFRNGDLGITLGDEPPGMGGGGGVSAPPPPPPALPGSSNPPKRRDPLLLDLAGTGIATVGLAAGLHFDHDGDGMKEATGWAGLGTGMLMLDRDGSGHLSNGSELFGDFTPVNGGIAVNGFLALAQYDRNHDGRIDAADPIWSQLKVWRHIADPLSGEAVIDDPDHAGELVGLDALGIVAIRLDAQGEASLDANGNTRLRTAWLEMADGSTRAIAEYRLTTNAGDATPQTLRYVDADIRALPELAGMGTVLDLHQAMQRDATLKGLVQQFAGAKVGAGGTANDETWRIAA